VIGELVDYSVDGDQGAAELGDILNALRRIAGHDTIDLEEAHLTACPQELSYLGLEPGF
jgi:hypothetical protein